MTADRKLKEIEKGVFNIFSDLAKMIGFSPIHASIVTALIAEGGNASLQDIARKTGYSVSMVSISLDFLEMLEIVKRIKKPTDRKLYIQLTDDLMGKLKNAILLRVQKSIDNALDELEEYRKSLERMERGESKELLKEINMIERHIKNLEAYVKLVSKIDSL